MDLQSREQAPNNSSLLGLVYFDIFPESLVFLIVHHIAFVSDVMITAETAGKVTPKVKGNGSLALLRFPVVLFHDRLYSCCRLFQMVVGHLGEKVMQHMGANVMVNFVEDTVVPVDCGQAASQVTPFLQQPSL